MGWFGNEMPCSFLLALDTIFTLSFLYTPCLPLFSLANYTSIYLLFLHSTFFFFFVFFFAFFFFFFFCFLGVFWAGYFWFGGEGLVFFLFFLHLVVGGLWFGTSFFMGYLSVAR